MLPIAHPVNRVGAPGPHPALVGPAADNVSIHTESTGRSRQVSNDCFEEKENQHIRMAEIFLRLKGQIRVYLITRANEPVRRREAENADRARAGQLPLPLLPPVSPFDVPADPAIGIIPGNKTYVYINENGERISGQLDDISFLDGVANPVYAAEIDNDVTEMIKILKDIKVLSSGGLQLRLFSPYVPPVSLRHRDSLFDYIAKDDALLKAFRDEMLKHITDPVVKTRVEEELAGNGPVDGSNHQRLQKKCDELLVAYREKVNAMPDGEAKATLDAAVKNVDIFAAKMLVIMRHIRDSEVLDATSRGRVVDQAGLTKQIGQTLKAFVLTQRDNHESKDGLFDVSYYRSQKVIDEDQKSEEDEFIDQIIELTGNNNPQREPGSVEDILLVGPLQVMKTTIFEDQRIGETDANYAARRAIERADIVRLDKLIGYGTKEHHYDPINAVRNANPAEVLYPRPEDFAARNAHVPPPQPGQLPQQVGLNPADSANHRYIEA